MLHPERRRESIRQIAYEEGFHDGYAQALSEMPKIIRCKDCDNKECFGREGSVVCGIDGTPHRPEWFCADGERQEGS